MTPEGESESKAVSALLLRAFCTARSISSSGEVANRIESALTHAWHQAQERYENVLLGAEIFAARIASAFDEGPVEGADIAMRVTDDLYLAGACLQGQREALTILDKEVLSTLPAAMNRLQLSQAAVDDAIARARAKLLVGKDGRGKLSDFSGTGDLRGWVKVIVIRDALREARKGKREVALSDELAAAIPSTALDADLAYQRKLYHSEFKESFAKAVDELSARDRSLLRQSLVYGATVDQVATVYQVHRATSARWIAKARDELANRTRSHLREKLSISQSQFESIVRLVESQMDLSIDRLLATASIDEKLED